MDHTKHNQFIGPFAWRYLLDSIGVSLFKEKWKGIPWPAFDGWGAVLDATRKLYNLLWLDFIELTAECNKLWEEVQYLRKQVPSKLSNSSSRFDFWSRMADHTPDIQAQYDKFMNRFYTDDDLKSRFLDWIVPARLVDAAYLAYADLREQCEKVEIERDEARATIDKLRAHPDDRITAWEKVYNAICTNWWSKGHPGRGDCGMDRAVNAIEDMARQAKEKVPGFGGVELTMDVRGTKVTGRVYELNPYGSHPPRKQLLAEREVAMPHFDKALAEIEALKKRNLELCAENMQLRAPVTYGVDIGKDDKTIITVRQGDKVLHVIDVSAERQNKEMLNQFKWADFASIEARMASKLFGYAVTPRQQGKSHMQWAINRAAYDAAQHTRRLNGRIQCHGKRWTVAMDADLRDMYRRGSALYSIAIDQGREWEAVLYRLAHLCCWPKAWLRPENHEKFLHQAWTWFFTVRGSPLPNSSQRVDALSRVPTMLP